MNLRRLTLICAAVILFSPYRLYADNFKNNFKANLDEKTLDALTKDLGALNGSGSFHTGKALGFPIGFDVGVHGTAIKVNKDDLILKDDSSRAMAGLGQVEIGLPMKINIIGRGGKVDTAKLVGGGLRFGILSPSLPGLPALSITGLYDRLDHDYFKVTTWSANAVLSIDFPLIDPYIGGGFDSSTLDLKDPAFEGVPAAVSRSLDGKANGSRVEAGVNLHLIPFTYLNLGAGLANGQAMYHAGAGVKF